MALSLAGAGAGNLSLTLVDPDQVDLSNLHRQLLYGEGDVGRPKVESAQNSLSRRAPGLRVHPVKARLGPDNAAALLAGHDVVVDGSDSIETKFLVNDTALRLGIPAVIGGVVRFLGQLLTVLPGSGACYRCLFEQPPPPDSVASCQQAGVLGPGCGIVGALQAAEVLHLLRGEPPAYAGALLSVDLRSDSYRRIALSRRPGCPACAAAAPAGWRNRPAEKSTL